MKNKFAVLLSILFIIAFVLGACTPAAAPTAAPEAPKPEAPAAPAATTAPEAPAASAEVINRAGVKLPADAAPVEKQILRLAADDAPWAGWDTSVYDSITSSTIGMYDSCVRPDRQWNPQPNACTSWKISDDGLTWTFELQKDKVWNDGTPVTADDFVFTLQRYARADYDFEWYYSEMRIVNWNDVANNTLPPEELGVKKIDDYTFSITTTQPVPYLIKIMADVWVVPKHCIGDRLADGTWATKMVCSTAPYKMDHWTKGKEILWVANDKYTGPFPPMADQILVTIMPPEARYNAYKNGELDIIGHLFDGDMTPATMAEVMADPELKKQLVSWPNFITFYLFFDTWNAPFDNLKVRQAFSHAIDREAIVNGPLQYQSAAAYTMNPPGFPGESVKDLKGIQNYDPEMAKKLMEEAGFPGGEGFPELVLYTRNASPAITNAAEAVAGMLKENIGVTVTIQNLDYSTYSEKMKNQKKQGGDFKLALVSYEFDFVDGSNLLGIWGGCSTADTPKPDLPGRHTWYRQDYNDLLCKASALMGNEDERNTLYRQAEKILLSDVALVPIWHGVYNVLIKPDIKGPALNPNPDGSITFWRMKFHGSEGSVYRTK